MSSFENPNFLKKKYDLHNSPEVKQASRRTEIRTGKKIPNSPEVAIQNYLNRFKEITDRTDEERRNQGLDALKEILHDKFIIKPDEIPESYFANQERLARERGQGNVQLNAGERYNLTEVIVTDQRNSLDSWVNYLASKDATYPDWLKYYAFRSILNMGAYDKEKHAFGARSKGTTKPFPDINREALAFVLDIIEKKYQQNIKEIHGDEELLKLLEGENFAKLYAYAIEKVTPASKESMESVAGEWVKYEHGTDHMPLVKSLQGHGTGWCTAGESTARAQLDKGDFYVFYSMNEDGQPKIPRAAIRMDGENIAEVRGIAAEQNLDPLIGDVVREKLTEFHDGPIYEKRSADMEYLTEIENKVKQSQELSKDDLIFLYEINDSINCFGYKRDLRISEILSTRNTMEDAVIVFECKPGEIAWSEQEITANTKAYVGPLFEGVFTKDFKYIYTSFPDRKINKHEVSIGGKTEEQIVDELYKFEIDGNKCYLSRQAEQLIKNCNFQSTEHLHLVRLKVKDLGFEKQTCVKDIYAAAEKIGLELCPAEAGPYFRLQYKSQPAEDFTIIAMQPQAIEEGNELIVFSMKRDEYGSTSLNHRIAKPGNQWQAHEQVVFRIPNK